MKRAPASLNAEALAFEAGWNSQARYSPWFRRPLAIPRFLACAERVQEPGPELLPAQRSEPSPYHPKPSRYAKCCSCLQVQAQYPDSPSK